MQIKTYRQLVDYLKRNLLAAKKGMKVRKNGNEQKINILFCIQCGPRHRIWNATYFRNKYMQIKTYRQLVDYLKRNLLAAKKAVKVEDRKNGNEQKIICNAVFNVGLGTQFGKLHLLGINICK